MISKMYHCPDCRQSLRDIYCRQCRRQFRRIDGIPVLFPKDRRYSQAVAISNCYDNIYEKHTNVWENVGRTKEFLDFFSSSILSRLGPSRLLEIGCGEGQLLALAPTNEKHAMDLSIEGIKKARARVDANFCLALAERIPYPAEFFDTIVAIGVMEHFLSIDAALKDIHRCLKRGGYYVSLVHVSLTTLDRVRTKIKEYVFPRPRPYMLGCWVLSRLKSKPVSRPGQVKQPIQNRRTTRGWQRAIRDAGFEVNEVSHTRRDASLPLKGRHVVIYVARKRQ